VDRAKENRLSLVFREGDDGEHTGIPMRFEKHLGGQRDCFEVHPVEQLQNRRVADAILPHRGVNPRCCRIDEHAIAPGFVPNFRRSNPVYRSFAFTNDKDRRIAKEQIGFLILPQFSRSR
jgi:hypothetical protein